MNIENTLDEITRLVGGWYNFVKVQPDVACVYNDKGKLNGMEPNVWIRDNLICGPVVFAGIHRTKDGEDFCSLSVGALSSIFSLLSYWGLR